MDLNSIREDQKVQTTELGPTTGMLIGGGLLQNRVKGVTGVILGPVPGHGGDVWWVRHDGGAAVVAPYVYTEFEPI